MLIKCKNQWEKMLMHMKYKNMGENKKNNKLYFWSQHLVHINPYYAVFRC